MLNGSFTRKKRDKWWSNFPKHFRMIRWDMPNNCGIALQWDGWRLWREWLWIIDAGTHPLFGFVEKWSIFPRWAVAAQKMMMNYQVSRYLTFRHPDMPDTQLVMYCTVDLPSWTFSRRIVFYSPKSCMWLNAGWSYSNCHIIKHPMVHESLTPTQQNVFPVHSPYIFGRWLFCDTFIMFNLLSEDHPIFPECVARVPLSLWGSGGWGCVRSTLRLRPQPFATVRGRAYYSLATVVTFGGFRRRVASFRVAGVALCEIPTCFITCHKSACNVWQAQYIRIAFRRWVAVFVAGAALDLHRHFAWQAQHFRRVASRIFTNRIVRAASSGDTVQIAWQAWQFVRCAENWRRPRTKRRFWGSKFWGS